MHFSRKSMSPGVRRPGFFGVAWTILITFGLLAVAVRSWGEDPEADPRLEALGALSATSIMATESFLGAAADGLTLGVYKTPEDIGPDLRRIVGLLEGCMKSLEAIPPKSLSNEDRKFIASLNEVFELQRRQANALIKFSMSKDKALLKEWLDAREEGRPRIEKLLGGNENVTYVNQRDQLGASLQQDYVHFSFSFPRSWKVDPKSGMDGESNFIRVELAAEENGEAYTLENFAVGSLTFQGDVSVDNELDVIKQVAKRFSDDFSKNFPRFQKIRQGTMKLGKYPGYGIEFVSTIERMEDEDIEIYGRVVLLPPSVTRQRNGATVLMMATSLREGIDSFSDLGVNGALPQIIESFEIGPAPKAKKKVW